jgi:hypothetical protein
MPLGCAINKITACGAGGNGACWGKCCADPSFGRCPTSSCHGNQLGDQEMNWYAGLGFGRGFVSAGG